MSGWPDTPWKYNPACHKRPLVCADEERKKRADAFVHRTDLGEFVRAALYFHALTDLEFFEFTVFSNLRLSGRANLPNGVVIFPCFVHDDGSQYQYDKELETATRRMQAASRFIYDGWMRITDWSPRRTSFTPPYLSRTDPYGDCL